MKYLLNAILLWSITTMSLFAESYGQAKSVVKPVRTTLKAKTGGVPTEINYQGWLGDTTDTTGITGNLAMIFRLYNDSTAGAKLWSETHLSVPVDKGIFNVILGIANPISSKYFYDGAPLWLETQVENDTLAPRKKLVSVGYAIKAEYADTAGYASSSAPDNDWTVSGSKLYAQDTSWNVGIGTASPFTDARLYVEANGKSYGVYGRGNTGKTAGVYGWANGAHYGVYGLGSTGKIAGMFGWANNADYGVYGMGSTGKVAGVYGKANGAHYGVYGAGSIGKVAGVYGKAGGASYAGYFDGNVHIEGTMTIDTVVRYYSIPACDFGAASEHYDWQRSSYLYTNTAGVTLWYAGVHLPDGAVVTEVNVYVLDNDTENIDFTLYRSTHNGANTTMATISSSGTGSGVRTFTDNIISHATIDNEDYCYTVKMVLKSGNANHRLCQIRIKYEITHPLP